MTEVVSGGGLPRWFDLTAALTAIIVLAPALILLAVLVRLTSPGPALFRQSRIGRAGRPFELLKLRSMRADTKGTAITASDDARVTAVGRFLRATKLDELPELWNVVRGDMALVGPRPEVPRYVDPEDARWREVLRRRPGLTCRTTLELRNEEAVLGLGADRLDLSAEAFYERILLPYKLERTIAEEAERTALRDLATMLQTAISIVRPGRSDPGTVLERVLAAARE